MAVRSGVGGFGSGFAQGFGLVSDYMNSQKRNRLAEEELEMNRNYRTGVLENERTKMENDRIRNKRLDSISQLTAETAGLRAKTEKTRAETALLTAQTDAKKYDDEGNLKPTPVDQARIETLQKQGAAADSAKGLSDFNLDTSKRERASRDSAIAISNVITYANNGDFDNAQRELENPALYDPMATFNIAKTINPALMENFQETDSLLRRVATGEPITQEMADNPYALAGIGAVIGDDRAQFIGSTIDSSVFPNAPEQFSGGRLINTGVFSLKPNDQGEIGFMTYNEVTLPDGSSSFYYAPLSVNRATGNAADATVTMDEAGKVMYGSNYAISSIQNNPVAVGVMEKHLKEQQFGGVKEFEKQLNERVDAFGKLISQKDPDTNIQGIGDDFGVDLNMTAGEFMARQDEVREQISRQMLYGRSKVSDLRRAQQFAADLKEQVPNFSVEVSTTTGSGQNRSRGIKRSDMSLDQLIEGGASQLTLNQLSKVNQLFKGEGNTLTGNNRKQKAETFSKLKELLTEKFDLKLTI